MTAMSKVRILLLLLLLAALALPAEAQQRKKPHAARKATARVAAAEKTHLLIILDCSKSMWDMWQSDAKIKITQQVLLRFIDSVGQQPDMEVALRVFGHLNNQSYGTRLEVPFATDNLYKLQSKIKTLVPNGGCDAASALTNSLNDFSQLGSERNIILIITDGIDDCAGEICDVARHVQLSGVIVQTFILGIGNRSDFKQNLSCAGKFAFVADEEGYTDALFDVLRQADESAQVTFRVTDADGLAYETSFPVVFYDSQTGMAKYSTIYGSSMQADADTLTIDPLVSYDITLFTRPEMRFSKQSFPPNQVSVLNVRLDEGQLRIRFEGHRTTWSVPNYDVLVHRQGDLSILNRQQVGDKVAYRAGLYDVEILSQPIVKLHDVEIRGDAATDLSLPAPGMLTISKPKTATVGSIFSVSDGRLEWVCDVNPNNANERLLLMPGDYQLVAKPQKANDFGSVRTIRFTIVSSELKHISF